MQLPDRGTGWSAVLKVMMLGPLIVEDDDGTRTAALGHKAQDLLVLLLAAPERTILREVAAETLWPDAPAEASRKAMRQVLWHTHKVLDDGRPERERLLVVDGDGLRTNPARPVWVDADDFVHAARAAGAMDPAAVSAAELRRLGRAADLYRGALHSGCYDGWSAVPRARLEDRALSLIDLLSRAHERHGAIDLAISWGQRLLDIEPAHERTHRRLMRLFAASGDRTRALRQLAECRRTLAQVLGVRPDGRTEALGRAVAAGSAPQHARLAGDPVRPVAPDADGVLGAAGLEVLRGELDALRRSIEAIGDRLRQAAV